MQIVNMRLVKGSEFDGTRRRQMTGPFPPKLCRSLCTPHCDKASSGGMCAGAKSFELSPD